MNVVLGNLVSEHTHIQAVIAKSGERLVMLFHGNLENKTWIAFAERFDDFHKVERTDSRKSQNATFKLRASSE